MRNKLHRVRSTDLDVLRSMLIEETLIDEKKPSSVDCNENYAGFGRVDAQLPDAIVQVPRASVKMGISRTPIRPFLITRIGSKHRWRPPVDSLQRDSVGENSEPQPLQTDLLATANRLWDQSLSEARRVFQDSLASHRLTSGCSGDLVQTAIAVIPQESMQEAATARVARTEHKLHGDDPETALWLQQKERERRRNKRQEVRQSLADSIERHEAHLRREKRQEAAQKAFEHWIKNKKIESSAVVKETAADATDLSSDCSEDPGPAQAGRQPRPSHKAYFRPIRCALRLKSAASFATDHSSRRMKVAGHQIIPLELQLVTPSCPPLSQSRPARSSGDLAFRPTLRPQTAGPSMRRPPLVSRSPEVIGELSTREHRDSIKEKRAVAKRRNKKSRRKLSKATVGGAADGLESERDDLRPAVVGRSSQTPVETVEADGELSSVSERVDAPNDDAVGDDDPWEECSLDSEAQSEK